MIVWFISKKKAVRIGVCSSDLDEQVMCESLYVRPLSYCQRLKTSRLVVLGKINVIFLIFPNCSAQFVETDGKIGFYRQFLKICSASLSPVFISGEFLHKPFLISLSFFAFAEMVLLHVKRGDESQFLLETTSSISIEDLTQEVAKIYNGRLKVQRVCAGTICISLP